ncbi:MAG TPA: hypothetical protein VKV24_17960 [Casimicrobiaceae bacterium]|nr:hypothetical protein [Casimicrobiaceae bacterium]
MKSIFETRMARLEAWFEMLRAQMKAELKAEVKSGLLQNLTWLSGIVLASNGMVIALLAARARRLMGTTVQSSTIPLTTLAFHPR